jgi:hypothetical protein
VFCDYLSIARPEYIKVEDSIFGVRFLAQFPASEIFLNRVGNIRHTGPIIGFEQGKEICAGNVEAFLMDQVENSSFELQEGNESDDSAARFLYNINRQITASEVTPETSAAVPNRSYYSVITELKKAEKAGPYLHEHECLGLASMRREAPVCLDKYGEMEPAIIKQEED